MNADAGCGFLSGHPELFPEFKVFFPDVLTQFTTLFASPLETF